MVLIVVARGTTTRSKKEAKTMKRTFMKFLPIAAAILLATSCSKDGDNDANIVNPNPEPEPIEVPVVEPQHYTLDFSLTVSNGASLSKDAPQQPEFPEFQEGEYYVLSITAGGTKVADLPIKTIADNKRSATFEGDLDFGANAELKAAVENKTTQLVASINADKKTETASYTSLDDALSASYYESEAFDYEPGGVEGISLVSRCAFIEFTVADGQKKVSIDDVWYPEDEKDGEGNITTVNNITNNYVCVAIPVSGTKSVKTRFRKSAKTISPNTIYTITCTDDVDLGPNFSVLWATCNLGALSRTDYGNYYAWGEIATKSSYDDDDTYTASEWSSDLNEAHDAAYNYIYDVESSKKLGDKGYRMPTKTEFGALLNESYCSKSWKEASEEYGVAGYEFTNDYGTIFLPAAGYREGADLSRGGARGYYWSSTCDDADYAWDLYFDSDYARMYSSYRCRGRSVRPVRCMN